MNTKQIELILKLAEKKQETIDFNQPFDILIHSVLNTIKFDELVLDFINNTVTDLNQSILSNIEKRTSSCSHRLLEKIYDDLKNLIEGSDTIEYHKSQRIRKALETLLLGLDNDYKLDFFNTFFNSKYSNDRKSAVKYVEYCTQLNANKLLDEFFSSSNIKFVIPILKEEYSQILSESIEGIWDTEPPFYIKKRLIELLTRDNFAKLSFLKKTEYDFYLLASLIAKKTTSKNALKQLTKIDKSKRHFALFNISKQIEFDLIEEEIKKYIS